MSAISKVGKESATTPVRNSGIQTARGLLSVLHIKNTKPEGIIVGHTLQPFNYKEFSESNKQFSAEKIESSNIQSNSCFPNPTISCNEEKKNFLENIRIRKDSLDKMNQHERHKRIDISD